MRDKVSFVTAVWTIWAWCVHSSVITSRHLLGTVFCIDFRNDFGSASTDSCICFTPRTAFRCHLGSKAFSKTVKVQESLCSIPKRFADVCTCSSQSPINENTRRPFPVFWLLECALDWGPCVLMDPMLFGFTSLRFYSSELSRIEIPVFGLIEFEPDWGPCVLLHQILAGLSVLCFERLASNRIEAHAFWRIRCEPTSSPTICIHWVFAEVRSRCFHSSNFNGIEVLVMHTTFIGLSSLWFESQKKHKDLHLVEILCIETQGPQSS